jgi:hypothetical protein
VTSIVVVMPAIIPADVARRHTAGLALRDERRAS